MTAAPPTYEREHLGLDGLKCRGEPDGRPDISHLEQT